MTAVYEYDTSLVIFFVICLAVGALCGARNEFLVSELKIRPPITAARCRHW